MNNIDIINQEIADSIHVVMSLKPEEINSTVNILADTIDNGNKIFVCGNGGSAADAQHFTGELVNKLRKQRKAYPAIALSCNTSNLTSIGNDTSFNAIFARQIAALGNEGDILIVLSTSGKSANIVQACRKAIDKNMCIIAFIGRYNQNLYINQFNPLYICVDSDDTPRIQQAHEVAFHIICQLLEDELENRKIEKEVNQND